MQYWPLDHWLYRYSRCTTEFSLFIGAWWRWSAWSGEAQPTRLKTWLLVIHRFQAGAQSEVDTLIVMSALCGFLGRRCLPPSCHVWGPMTSPIINLCLVLEVAQWWLDTGTSSIICGPSVLSEASLAVEKCQVSFPTHYPKPIEYCHLPIFSINF